MSDEDGLGLVVIAGEGLGDEGGGIWGDCREDGYFSAPSDN